MYGLKSVSYLVSRLTYFGYFIVKLLGNSQTELAFTTRFMSVSNLD